VFHGSDGVMPRSAPATWGLRHDGFNVIAVQYFQGPTSDATGLFDALDRIPLEPILKLIDQPNLYFPNAVKKCMVAYGISKGGELALLLASRDPNIKGVVAGVPSSVVWDNSRKPDSAGDSIDLFKAATPASSWTYGGEELPYVRYDRAWMVGQFLTTWGWQYPYNWIRQLHDRSLSVADAATLKYAGIPVEKIIGPVGLVSRLEDHYWPSYPMSLQVMERLRQFDPNRFILHNFEQGNHFASDSQYEAVLPEIANRACPKIIAK
jgi:hypothetical protein